MPERSPPRNDQAEAALLGALLLDGERALEIVGTLAPEDFFVEAHRVVFGSIARLADGGAPIDSVTVANDLAGRGETEKAGGLPRLLALMEAVTSSAHVEYHARLVRGAGYLRAAIRTGTEIVRLGFESPSDPETVASTAEEIERVHGALSYERSGNDPRGMDEILRDHVDALLASEDESPTGKLSTGLTDFDRFVDFKPGREIVIAARPGVGKSALMLELAARAASTPQRALGGRPARVLIFSLEMSESDLLERLIARTARVELEGLTGRRLWDADRAKVDEAVAAMRDWPILIDDQRGSTIAELRSRARRTARTRGVDLIVVDYLQLVRHPGAESREREVSSVVRALRDLAGELEVPLLALAQLNRESEKRAEGGAPRLSDLRESGEIEQAADTVVMLHPDANDPTLVQALVRKNRAKPTGSLALRFFRHEMRFESPALDLIGGGR